MLREETNGITPGTGCAGRGDSFDGSGGRSGGFEAIFAGEVNIDALAAAQLMGEATSSIKVGTWVANIYLRRCYLCAKHAALIADATGGRMVLGLGVSHQPVNKALGIDMPSPIDALRRYTTEVAGWWVRQVPYGQGVASLRRAKRTYQGRS